MALPCIASQDPIDLKADEKVAIIGGTFVERASRYGYLEAALTSNWPGDNVVFRNLGWSGDTVNGLSRDYFGKHGDGYKRLIKLLMNEKPSLVILAYGGNEAFAGEAGLPTFLEGMNGLGNEIDKLGARVVVLSPPPHEALGGPLPDPAAHNERLKLYSDGLKKFAAKRKYRFIDLFAHVDDGRSVITYRDYILMGRVWCPIELKTCLEIGERWW